MPTRTQRLDPDHGNRRAAQRGIGDGKAAAILACGTAYRSYNRQVFVITDRDCLRHGLDASRFRGLALVLEGECEVTRLRKFSISQRPGVASRSASRERQVRRQLRAQMQRLRAGSLDFDLFEA
jgi:hypothetical protein